MSILLKQDENENANENIITPSTLSSMSNPSNTTMNRGERHPIMDQSIAIDNNTLNSIINSILQTKNDSNSNNNNGINNGQEQEKEKEHPPDSTQTSNDGENTQQYLLPVDLLISVDKSQNATVKAALPSTFAFQQPMISTVPLLPSIPMTFTPSVASVNTAYQAPLTPAPSIPASSIPTLATTTPTGLPSVPMVPSIPMSLLSQPQMPIITNPMTMNTMNSINSMNSMNINQFMPQQMMFPQHHQQNRSTLNPSAQTFTPTTTYSAFGHNMNKIAPISEICNNDEEKIKEDDNQIKSIHGHNGDGDDFINDETDAWYMIDEKSKKNAKISHPQIQQQQAYKPPIPTHKNNNKQTADSLLPSSQTTMTITSPSFNKRKSRYFNNHEDDTRQYNKSWRNFGNKRDNNNNKVILPPRWRSNDHIHNTPKISHSYSFHPKPIKLLVEFVKHVTLPNRENYPPNTVLTKTWYVFIFYFFISYKINYKNIYKHKGQ